MDSHSIKRPRIMPPEERHPVRSSEQPLSPHSPSYRPTDQPIRTSTSSLGLNSSSMSMINTVFAPAASPQRMPSEQRRRSLSNGQTKDILFHKNTSRQDPHVNNHSQHPRHHQLDQQKAFQQLQLQEAHQEFHRQRILHQQQQQQLQEQLQQQQRQHSQHEHAPSWARAFSASTTPSQRDGQPLHYHHHHHHHHYHVPTNLQGAGLQTHLRSLGGSSSQAYSDTTLSTVSRPSSADVSVSESPPSSSARHHHHHHHHRHQGPHQHHPQRSNQFSEWTTVKEKERARLLSNMARARESQVPVPSAEAAKENLKRLSHRIHQRRTRARETILFDLHQGVKTVEAQVHKQVDMVFSRLKDTPGSKYAFALTHTFLTQLPQALSNTILPSAISAVADTVASRTTNSLTALRGAAGEDEFDEDDEDEDDEDAQDEQDDPEEYSHLPSTKQMQQDSGLSLQLSNEFGTIALASVYGAGLDSSTARNNDDTNKGMRRSEGGGGVSLSSAGASEFLAASTHHNYSSAASQVLSAALPSFIPSMVAPIVCVFSYPSPPTTKPNSPSLSSPSSPNMDNLQKDDRRNELSHRLSKVPTSRTEAASVELQVAIKADPGVAQVTGARWTTAEQEALFLAATRFRLRGQWTKIRQMMNLHRTETEIAEEYQRLYGDEDNDMGDQNDDDDELVSVKREESDDEGDADNESDDTVFLRFGGRRPPSSLHGDDGHDASPGISRTADISKTSHLNRRIAQQKPSQSRQEDLYPAFGLEPIPHYGPQDHAYPPLAGQKPLHVVKKEFMIDKRFSLEDIPMRL